MAISSNVSNVWYIVMYLNIGRDDDDDYDDGESNNEDYYKKSIYTPQHILKRLNKALH